MQEDQGILSTPIKCANLRQLATFTNTPNTLTYNLLSYSRISEELEQLETPSEKIVNSETSKPVDFQMSS